VGFSLTKTIKYFTVLARYCKAFFERKISEDVLDEIISDSWGDSDEMVGGF